MRILLCSVLGLLCALLVPALRADEKPPTVDDVRKSVERSLPFLEKAGTAWKEKKNCVSCHQIPYLVWSLHEARERGFAIDQKRLDEWDEWAMTSSLTVGNVGLDSQSAILLALSSGYQEKDVAKLESLQALVLKQQAANGTWKPGGQLSAQQRPERDAYGTTTMWTILALATTEKGRDSSAKARELAATWIKESKPPATTEGMVLGLLMEHRFGDAKRMKEIRKELLDQQKADGGWSWRKDAKSSDAFATGQVLYALGTTGVDASDPVIGRAWKFLIETQKEDGSWLVDSKGFSAGTDPKRFEKTLPIYVSWGGAWATIGLCKTLPEAKKSAEGKAR